MSGFKKAKAEQAALKVGLYGLAGSGKTLTALLCAEGLVEKTGKRIAYVDTERGTDFYAKEVKERTVHPKAFDFDALYTKSITEVLQSIKALKPEEHGVIIIDSITHIWEAAKLAYSGPETRIGTIPLQAWSKIKKPYKELMNFLLSSPIHVFFCGRQGNEFGEDEESGELKKIGVKMKAEGETPYEPHILIRMETLKDKQGNAVITAFAEKDRTSVLAGRTIELKAEPGYTYKTLVQPILSLLGDSQAQVETEDETAAKDSEALNDAEKSRNEVSAELVRQFSAKFDLAKVSEEVESVSKEITTAIKKQMSTSDVNVLREKYSEALKRVK